ncbi:hypothetical protein QYM36_012804 [Artemia franciscana]|uniref:Reverse transcriptase domain-containing protein n=1 Tax=Artemia franciscana TaxID=6661 RepID=A0AA88HLT8_ARTSF|nr:hypothetical protein QYM36_012804 [Artemia franciscana]
MKGMKASKAFNPDGIPSFILKEVRDELCEPLAILFQISFEQCKFPTSWKLSHVTPIFKGKGKRSDPEKYRPISLTSPFLKIMERVIVEKLNSHLELNNLISDHQHGFRKNRSTASHLVVIHDYIQSTLDRGIPIYIILIDLLKAFDRISLRKLIHCLEIYGIKGQLKNWLSAYLNDRKIAVKVADTLSTWIDATSGVPQGSVLGPVLFVMYIDICINAISQTDFGLFADDTKLLGEASASSQIQSDLDALAENLEEWQLSPNLAKCSVVHLGCQNPMYSYKMKGIDLTKSTCEKDLGVILTLDLKPEKHIGLIVHAHDKGTANPSFNQPKTSFSEGPDILESDRSVDDMIIAISSISATVECVDRKDSSGGHYGHINKDWANIELKIDWDSNIN